MKKIMIICLFPFLVYGCSIKNNKETESESNESLSNDLTSKSSFERSMIGSYVGPFGDNVIRVVISKVEDGTIEGRSIVAGYDRPFIGSYKVLYNEIKAEAEEPGDDINDGMFSFIFSFTDMKKVSGEWSPFNEGKSRKDFVLNRIKFVYRKNVGYFPQTSTRYLDESDVDNKPKDELKFMRNEIFARHGYCFNKKELRDIFEGFDWYVPATSSIVSDLTDIEKKNIQLIKRYEEYASEYGDFYGR